MHVTVPFSILFYAYIPTTPCMGRLLHPACCPPSCEPGCSSLGAFKNAGIYAPFFGALCTAAFLTEQKRPLKKNTPAHRKGDSRRGEGGGPYMAWSLPGRIHLPSPYHRISHHFFFPALFFRSSSVPYTGRIISTSLPSSEISILPP